MPFQTFAAEYANIRALRVLHLDRSTARILDVGCGSGAGLLQFLKLGFNPVRMAGVDISYERLEEAGRRLPSADFRCESADRMSFPDETFDVVFESTMFVLMPDDDMATRIAADMIRVTRRNKYIILVEWRYSKPRTKDYAATNNGRIARLFRVGSETSFVTAEPGALIPPIGRFLSRRLPSFYFLAQSLLPPAVGQMTTVLRRA